MNNETYNIFIAGVGGQGIGLLSEIIIRAADYAGWTVNGADTHGLAQRGGMVASHIRLGNNCASPLIRRHHANLVVALETHEALRGMEQYLKPGGKATCYLTTWQPLTVRLGQAKEVKPNHLEEAAKKLDAIFYPAVKENLPDARMQNVVVLAAIAKNQLIPDVTTVHIRQAMDDLMKGAKLEANLEIFESCF